MKECGIFRGVKTYSDPPYIFSGRGSGPPQRPPGSTPLCWMFMSPGHYTLFDVVRLHRISTELLLVSQLSQMHGRRRRYSRHGSCCRPTTFEGGTENKVLPYHILVKNLKHIDDLVWLI